MMADNELALQTKTYTWDDDGKCIRCTVKTETPGVVQFSTQMVSYAESKEDAQRWLCLQFDKS